MKTLSINKRIHSFINSWNKDKYKININNYEQINYQINEKNARKKETMF